MIQDGVRASRLSKQCNPITISSKELDVVVHPLQCHELIIDSKVTTRDSDGDNDNDSDSDSINDDISGNDNYNDSDCDCDSDCNCGTPLLYTSKHQTFGFGYCVSRGNRIYSSGNQK